MKFDYTNNWYIHNQESVRENETHKLLRNFKCNRIMIRWPDLVIVHKKTRTCRIVDFAVPTDRRIKLKEIEKKNKYLDLARELKKTMKHESDGDTNCNWRARYTHQRIGTGTGGVGNEKTSGDHPNYNIVEIG